MVPQKKLSIVGIIVVASVFMTSLCLAAQKGGSCKYEENCNCKAPGITLRWQAAYCMSRSETDDFANETVQKCMAEKNDRSYEKKSNCKKNEFWKAKICALHTGDALKKCQSENFIPRAVENGV